MKILDKWKSAGLVDNNKYNNMYKDSIEKNEEFWKSHGEKINWIKEKVV